MQMHESEGGAGMSEERNDAGRGMSVVEIVVMAGVLALIAILAIMVIAAM